jgi:TRAP-type C4-dicarboxylate transport system permease large subunit
LSSELYRVSYAFLGHRRGGLAMATILACGGFGAVCGSSLATAATMSKVAMPSMRKYGYSDALAAGSIAAGGTLGILIPPSVVMVIYGILTETEHRQAVHRRHPARLVAIACYLAAVAVTVRIDAKAGPRGERVTWHERLVAIGDVWGVLILFLIVIGGIYGGIFTPTEAAGIGAGGGLAFLLLRKGWTGANCAPSSSRAPSPPA